MSAFPDGWETRRHAQGFDYYRAAVTGGSGLDVAIVYADPRHVEVEVGVHGTLTPDEARALAVRLVEAAEAIDAATRGGAS